VSTPDANSGLAFPKKSLQCPVTGTAVLEDVIPFSSLRSLSRTEYKLVQVERTKFTPRGFPNAIIQGQLHETDAIVVPIHRNRV